MKMTGVKGQIVKMHKKWDVTILPRWETQKRVWLKTRARLLTSMTGVVEYVGCIVVGSVCVVLCQVPCLQWVCGLRIGPLHNRCTWVLGIQWADGSVTCVWPIRNLGKATSVFRLCESVVYRSKCGFTMCSLLSFCSLECFCHVLRSCFMYGLKSL